MRSLGLQSLRYPHGKATPVKGEADRAKVVVETGLSFKFGNRLEGYLAGAFFVLQKSGKTFAGELLREEVLLSRCVLAGNG